MTFTNLVQPHKAEEMCEYMNIKSYLLRGIEKCGFIADIPATEPLFLLDPAICGDRNVNRQKANR
jgi:hypothetical protein